MAQTRKRIQMSVLVLAAIVLAVGVDFSLDRLKVAPMTLSAQGNGPILPLAANASGDAPFLALAARDPELVNKMPEDDNDAGRLASEMKSARADLAHSKGERATELNEEAYKNGVALAYYFEGQGAKGQASLATIRPLILQHIAALTAQSKSESVKATAQFHALALTFASGNRHAAVAGLEKLEKSRLPATLKARARLLVAIAALESGKAAERNKAAVTIAASAKTLSPEGQVAAHLTVARALAGVDRGGQRRGKPSANYKNHLYAASQAASGLSDAKKTQTLRFAVGIWRAAEGAGGAWDKVPFKLSAFGELMEAKAIVERSALSAWARNDRAAAFKTYQSLSVSLNGRAEKGPIDLRLLDLYRADYASTRNPRAYEQALLRAEKSYLDPAALGERQEASVKAMAQELARRHEVLVDGEIRRVSVAQASKPERLAAIALANTLILNIDDKQKIESFQARIAHLYALNAQHREAVAVYKDLAENTKTGKAATYLALAINSQSVLASWPKDVPWNGFAAGNTNEREELLALYQRYTAANGGALNWQTLGHTGLLQTALGQADQAFAAWTAALKQDGRGAHAANAAGYMLLAYQKANDWSALESLARLCLKVPVAATYRGRSLAVMQLFELALLEGGKVALKDGQYKLAILKLKEFTDAHPRAANHDEGFFLLASAYHGNVQHHESIATLVAFVARYPASKYLRHALLNGGDWATPMAYEDNALSFYQNFATQFPADPEATRVRDLLLALYRGRGLYAQALAVLDATVKAPGLTAEKKADALVQAMAIEERQGSPDRADKLADKLIAASDAPDDAKAEAYGVKARSLARLGNTAALRALEQVITARGPTSAQSQQALGEARYYQAVATSRSVVQRFFNLALKDPSQTLEQRFAGFMQARAAFQKVCEGGPSSYCAPALHKLARLGEDFSKTLDDIAIQETLAAATVKQFNTRKQAIMDEVMRVIEDADDKALANVAQGHTDPDWTQAVLWQNTSDWNFDRVSGEAGNGYLQWSSQRPRTSNIVEP